MDQHHRSTRRRTPARLLNILLLLVACGLVPLLHLSLLESALDELDKKA
jgi:hypothetical protein